MPVQLHPFRLLAILAVAALLLLPTGSIVRAQDPGDHALEKTDKRNATMAERVSRSVVAIVPLGTALGDWYSVAGGAGFCIDSNGHILTALINVGSASRINVVLPGGKMVRAEVVGRDARNGCALLKVDRTADELPPLTFANSESLSVGATAYTFGNPFSSIINDDQVAFSSGTISGRYRPAVPDSGAQREQNVGLYAGPVIETTCAINDGTFGGPLTDRHGHVIGMVVKLISYQRWLGTAVPIHQIAIGLPRLRSGQEPLGADAGMTLENATGSASGARIDAVTEGGPAAAAGLKADEVIVKADQDAVDSAAALATILADQPPGARLVLQVKSASGEESRFVPITLAVRKE